MIYTFLLPEPSQGVAMCRYYSPVAMLSASEPVLKAAMQVEELRELQAEWKQEYQIRRQMLIERAKVPPL